jgi:hypothetical protein
VRNVLRPFFVPLTVGLGVTLLFLGLLGSLGPRQEPALAAAANVYCVTPDGGTYAACTQVFTHVQAAVDAATGGEEIRVAAGTYTGVRNVPTLKTGTFTATQVLVITKSLTIRGGYSTANWTTPDPAANRTTLDAEGRGRVVYIVGDPSAGSGQAITPTLEGLRITGGDATGLGGRLAGRDAGGGVYINEAAATISDCMVYSNTASTARDGWAGGLYLDFSNATLRNNTVASNTASTGNDGWGGGVYLWSSDAMLIRNTVRGNFACTAWTGYGGGMGFRYSDATLIGNTVQGNTASASWSGYGGGLYLRLYSDATLIANTVQGNTASGAAHGDGGGLYLQWSDSTLVGNTVVSNTATLDPRSMGHGGGLVVRQSSPVILTNNLVAGNRATTQGSGLWFGGTNEDLTHGTLLHNTIADNGSTMLTAGGSTPLTAGGSTPLTTGGSSMLTADDSTTTPAAGDSPGLTADEDSGQGVFVDDYTTLAFTNTIIAGHSGVGITVTAGSTAALEATLWDENGLDTGGAGAISTGMVNVYDDPAFVEPAAWNYHIAARSPAIGAGVEAGVTTDIDGDKRPQGIRCDIGADEFVFFGSTYLPLVLR